MFSSSRRTITVVMTAIATASFVACADDSGPTTPSAVGEALVRPTATDDAIGTLTRVLSLALNDVGVRQRVLADMRAAPFLEHKLVFDDYVHRRNGALLHAMAEASGRGPQELAGLLSSLPSLEFYMPVREHRLHWQAGADLIVASQLDEDDVPVGYDPDGRAVPLSAAAPPVLPTLVLVPVESDFTRPLDLDAWTNVTAKGAPGAIGVYRRRDGGTDGSEASATEICPESADPGEVGLACTGGGTDGGTDGGSGGTTDPPDRPDGLYFDKMVVWDDGEGWPRGEAEMEVHIFGTQRGLYVPIQVVLDPYTTYWDLWYDASLTRLVQFSCAGEKASGYRHFNFDGEDGATFTEVVLFAETENFAMDEMIYDNVGRLAHRRLDVLEPPFEVWAIERDDGSQCPTPPTKVRFEVDFRFYLIPTPWNWVEGADAEDISALLGGGNDQQAGWTFDAYTDLESWSYDKQDASAVDIWLRNRGFDDAAIPPEQDPYNP